MRSAEESSAAPRGTRRDGSNGAAAEVPTGDGRAPVPVARGSPWSELAGRAGLVVGSVAVAFGIVELSLRLLAPIPHSMELDYVEDGHLGARLRPDRVYQTPAGGTVTVNNLGYRGNRAISYEKPPGVFRIVVLGGSSAFSFDTSDERIWTALLEEKLRKAFGPHVEVVNAAIPGQSAFEAKMHYLCRIQGMSPDVVVVCAIWNGMKYFREVESGRPLEKGVRSAHRVERFLKHFELAWRLRHLYNTHVKPRWRENVYGESLTAPVNVIPRGGRAHRWERRNYEDLAVLLRKDGALPVFVSEAGLLSRDNYRDPRIGASVHAEMVGLGFSQIVQQWEAVTSLIRDVAAEHDAVFIDAYNALPHTFDVFTDHVHLTDRGNALMAEVVYGHLEADPRFRSRAAYPRRSLLAPAAEARDPFRPMPARPRAA